MPEGYDFKKQVYTLEYEMDIPQLFDSEEFEMKEPGSYCGLIDRIKVKIVLNKDRKTHATLYAKTKKDLNETHRRITDILDAHNRRDPRFLDFI